MVSPIDILKQVADAIDTVWAHPNTKKALLVNYCLPNVHQEQTGITHWRYVNEPH